MPDNVRATLPNFSKKVRNGGVLYSERWWWICINFWTASRLECPNPCSHGTKTSATTEVSPYLAHFTHSLTDLKEGDFSVGAECINKREPPERTRFRGILPRILVNSAYVFKQGRKVQAVLNENSEPEANRRRTLWKTRPIGLVTSRLETTNLVRLSLHTQIWRS